MGATGRQMMDGIEMGGSVDWKDRQWQERIPGGQSQLNAKVTEFR